MHFRWSILTALLVSLAVQTTFGVSIEGEVSYSGTATGLLLVAVITNVEDVVFEDGWEWEGGVTGPFTNDYLITNLPANTYYVIGILETNDLSDEWVPWGHYTNWAYPAVPIDTDPGDTVSNVNFQLIDGSVSNNPYVEEGGIEYDERICGGTPATCLDPLPNWEYEGMVVDEPYFFDSWVVETTNGWYRLYGNSRDQVLNGTNAFDSYLSSNGVDFVLEPGHRYEEPGCFMPYVLHVSGAVYRCYYTDQSYMPNCGAGECGGRAIRTAISTNGGLDFVTEGDSFICDTNLSYEFKGIRGARLLELTNGNYRMYYHAIDSNGYWRVLSATSSNGTNWTREGGVRMDPATFCPVSTSVRNFAPIIPFSDGVVYLYIAMSACDVDWGDSQSGIFECRSSDGGLSFTPAGRSILLNYYVEDTFQGDPMDPQIMAQDPTAIMTTNGLRMYFGLYDGPSVITNISGIYSMLKWDFDDDGSDDWEEYVAGTNPHDSNSLFAVADAAVEDIGGGTQAMVVGWSSATGRSYRIDRSTNLLTGFDQVVATNLTAIPVLNVYTDETASGMGPYFYRVEVEQ